MTAAGQPVATEATTTDAVEAAPASAPEAVAPEAAPDTAAEATAVPAATTAAPEEQAGADGLAPAEDTAAQNGEAPHAAPGGMDEAAVQAATAQAAATAATLAAQAPPEQQQQQSEQAAPMSSGALEQTLHIPGTMVGKLIGKQGETIKGLQYSTNTRIQVMFGPCHRCCPKLSAFLSRFKSEYICVQCASNRCMLAAWCFGIGASPPPFTF